MRLWTGRRSQRGDPKPEATEYVPDQWIPGKAKEAHTWIDPWSADTVRSLLDDADAAGWISHVIDSDVHGRWLRGQDQRIDGSLLDLEPAVDQLLNQLATELELRGARGAGRETSHSSVLLVVGASAKFVRDRRLLALARRGRLVGMHLAVDRAAVPLLMGTASGPELRDNILGTRAL